MQMALKKEYESEIRRIEEASLSIIRQGLDVKDQQIEWNCPHFEVAEWINVPDTTVRVISYLCAYGKAVSNHLVS